ncbi:MAG TPA: RNA polymerase subunit sigma-70 [Polyangiaceae bacterium]
MTDFEQLVEPHRARLRLHCYRMLGSSCDADDMVQETLVRAFRSRATLHDPSLVRPWLYRIATNVCLDELSRRPRRALGPELGPPYDQDKPPPAPTPDVEWIEPCPSSWLVAEDATVQYTSKESVALAFVAVLQVLTPAQRAVLLLRDVVGLTAHETAIALESSVSAVNSALHRARTALETHVGPSAGSRPSSAAPVDRALLQQYLSAWESGDFGAVVALLHTEATFSMPPVPAWFAGRAAIARFFENMFCPTLQARTFRLRPVEANARDAAAFYRAGEDGRAHLFAIQLIAAREGQIVTVEHMMAQSALVAFRNSGLPMTVEL